MISVLSDLFKCCTQNVVYLSECSTGSWQEGEACVLYYWVKSFMDINYIHLIDSGIVFHRVLTGFLHAGQVHL